MSRCIPGNLSRCHYFGHFQLIEALIAVIQHLESEVVRTRWKLSCHLPDREWGLTRSDILSGLAGQYAGDPAYDAFAEDWYGGKDPMDVDKWVEYIRKLAHGEESNLW